MNVTHSNPYFIALFPSGLLSPFPCALCGEGFLGVDLWSKVICLVWESWFDLEKFCDRYLPCLHRFNLFFSLFRERDWWSEYGLLGCNIYWEFSIIFLFNCFEGGGFLLILAVDVIKVFFLWIAGLFRFSFR